MKKQKFVVGYYMKGKPKQYKTFETFKEYQIFCTALSKNPNCESFGRERNV